MNSVAFLDLTTADLAMAVSLVIAVAIVIALIKLGRRVYKSFFQGYSNKEN